MGYDCVYGCGLSSMPSYSGLADMPQQPWIIRVFQQLELIAASTPRNRIFRKIYHRLIDRAWRIVVLFYVLRNFDAVVYGFGSFILFRRELVLMKLLGIKTLHVFHGSDSRHPAIDGSYFSDDRRKNVAVAIDWCRKMKRKMTLIERYADYIAMSPTTAHFLTKPFLNWHLALGMPFVGKAKQKNLAKGDVIRMVHCPSLMAAKGTKEIVQCVENLKHKGYNIEFTLIHGKPHHEVINALSESDIAIDQLYSDLVFSGFGAEAAFYGVLPVTCGYADLWYDVCKDYNIPTCAYFHPEKLEERLEFLIQNPEVRNDWAAKCQEFVTNQWAVDKIATNLVAILKGESPAGWYCDPLDVFYCYGVGVSRERAADGIRQFIEYGGESVLCLDHNQPLSDAFVAFTAS